MRRKREWFPVVATDFFCGLLGAVIVMDAAVPRVSPTTPSTFLDVHLAPDSPGSRCEDFALAIDVGGQVFVSSPMAKKGEICGAGFAPRIMGSGTAVPLHVVLLAAVSDGDLSIKFKGVEHHCPLTDVARCSR